MIEKVKYMNHLNEVIEFGNGIFVNESELHDYEWKYTENNKKISSFDSGIAKRTIPVTICCSSASEGLALKNRLMEVCEKDVLAMQYGKLIVGNYYLKCYVTASRKNTYLQNKGVMNADLTITTDLPKWVKESTYSFTNAAPTSRASSGKRNFDYNFDFPFDYASEMLNQKLNNTGFTGAKFKLIVYEGALNPSIVIGGHEYGVDCTVDTDEYLTIDSLEKTIILTKADGTKVNLFNNRHRESYIFEPIPAGENNVSYSGGYGFDVILMEERSEPKWI